MSGVVPIPGELREFLELAGPQTMLIRGPPGSGKTTLGLALLESFRGDKFLVTSRVPSRELHREFGWLGNNGSRSIQVVDTAEMDESIHNIARILRHARQALLAPRTEGDRETDQFLWLPPPLQEVWSRVSATTPSLIVVDSWDALIEGFLGGPGDAESDERVPDRGQIERMLIRRMSRAPAHIVFILEREDQTALDYLVNGVVVTSRTAAEDRLERWMSLSKLRGVRIATASYPFTLEGGRFESILPVQAYETVRAGPPDPETDALPGFLWPGSKDFAASFGRLPFGRMSLIELDADASTLAGDILAVPAIAHVLRSGGRVLTVPHTSETPEDLMLALNGTVSRDRFLRNVRMILTAGATPPGAEELWKVVLHLPKPAAEAAASTPAPSESEAIRFLREGVSQTTPGLIVLSLQGLIGLANSVGLPPRETVSRLPSGFQAAMRGLPIHAMVFARKGGDGIDTLRAAAATRLDVTIRHGRIFLHGLTPWTSSFVLTEGDERAPYSLTRVV